jgi:hypothetical protein
MTLGLSQNPSPSDRELRIRQRGEIKVDQAKFEVKQDAADAVITWYLDSEPTEQVIHLTSRRATR